MKTYTVYSKPDCGHCVTMKQLIKDSGNEYVEINTPDLGVVERANLIADAKANSQRMMPMVYLDGVFITNTILEAELNERTE